MYDGAYMHGKDEGKSKILRTELVHGSENVVDFLVELMHKAAKLNPSVIPNKRLILTEKITGYN